MHIYQHIQSLLQDVEKPIFLEIGCHWCEDTEQILHILNHKVEYYCFEPDPRNIRVIKNSDIAWKIKLLEYAIGDFNGQAELYLSEGHAHDPKDNWTGSSSILEPTRHLTEHPWCRFKEKILVDVKTLDTFCLENAVNHIDMIWQDLQGAESLMVKGAQKALSFTKYLYSEYSNTELYRGQKPMNEWISMLPGKWEIIEVFPNDVLLKNLSYNNYNAS